MKPDPNSRFSWEQLVCRDGLWVRCGTRGGCRVLSYVARTAAVVEIMHLMWALLRGAFGYATLTQHDRNAPRWKRYLTVVVSVSVMALAAWAAIALLTIRGWLEWIEPSSFDQDGRGSSIPFRLYEKAGTSCDGHMVTFRLDPPPGFTIGDNSELTITARDN